LRGDVVAYSTGREEEKGTIGREKGKSEGRAREVFLAV